MTFGTGAGTNEGDWARKGVRKIPSVVAAGGAAVDGRCDTATLSEKVLLLGWLLVEGLRAAGGGDVYSCEVDGVVVKVGMAFDDVAAGGCVSSDGEDCEDGRRNVAGLKLGAGAAMGAGCTNVGCCGYIYWGG